MTESTFERVTRSDQPLHGPRRLLLCGFGPGAQKKFRTVLEMAGLSDVSLVWAGDDQAETVLSDLLELPDGSGADRGSGLPRAIVVGGIREKELHRLMAVCRKAGMKNALWAVLTPTSETWPLSGLLAELAREREALGR